jgi:hypothetical protein
MRFSKIVSPVLLSFASLASLVSFACSSPAPAESSNGARTEPLGPSAAQVRNTHAEALLPMTGPAATVSSTQIRQALGTFMASTTKIGIVGRSGEQLFGGENLGRTQAGDQGAVWHDANTVEMLADYQLATGDSSFQSVIETYANGNYNPLDPYGLYGCGNSGGINLGTCNQPNAFNDDDLWWGLAFMRAHELETKLGNTAVAGTYWTGAVDVFQHVCAQWDAVPGCGGGVPQTAMDGTAPTYRNAITNELLFQLAMKLYLLDPTGTNVCTGQVPWTNDPSAPSHYPASGPGGLVNQFPNDYLGWALAEYEWFKQYWWSAAPATTPMADGLDSSCNLTGTQLTYNQGPILGALLDLSTVPSSALTSHVEYDSSATILTHGFDVASAAMSTFVQTVNNASGTTFILTEEGSPTSGQLSDVNNTCAWGNGDCPQFKGVFMRYLGRFVNGAQPQWGQYANYGYQFTAATTTFLTSNANAIWAHSANGTLLPELWNYPAVSGYDSWDAQTSSTSALDAMIATIGLQGPPPPAPPPPPVSVTGLSASSGFSGQNITVSGTGFSTALYGTQIIFGGTVAYPLNGSCASATSCEVTVPAGPVGTVDVTVSVNGFTSNLATADRFAYGEPIVTGFAPTSGPSTGGTYVTVQGGGLVNGMTVYFGLVPVTLSCGPYGCETQTPPGAVGNAVEVLANLAEASASPTAPRFTYADTAVGLTIDQATIFSGGPSTATIALDVPAPAGGTLVTLTSASSVSPAATVTAPASVLVPAGSTDANFTFTVSMPEPFTTVTFTAAAGGATVSASAQVVPAQTVSITPLPLFSGQATTGTITLNEQAEGNVVVTLAAIDNPTSGAAATIAIPASVTIPSGSTSATFPFTATTTNPANRITVTATVNGTPATETFNVLLGDIALLTNASSLTPGQTTKAFVYLRAPAPAGGASVTLTNSNATALSAPTTVTVPAGATTSAPLTLTANAMAIGGRAVCTLTASEAGNSSSVAVTVSNPKPIIVEPPPGGCGKEACK